MEIQAGRVVTLQDCETSVNIKIKNINVKSFERQREKIKPIVEELFKESKKDLFGTEET